MCLCLSKSLIHPLILQQLFLDDSKMKNFTSCFKDKKFLHFFFTRIRVNQTNRYKDDFPFISMCGRETNYVRCDDTPVVFTHVFKDGHAMKFAYGHAANLLFHPFEPWNICMVPETGRIYHPSTEFTGGFGLIKSSLAIEISNNFLYENQLDPKPGHFESPSHIIWDGVRYSLTNSLLPLIYSKPFI